MSPDLMQVFSICAGLLTLLLLALAFHTGTVRGFIENTYFNPEDVVMGKGKAEKEDGPKTQRWARVGLRWAWRDTIGEQPLPPSWGPEKGSQGGGSFFCGLLLLFQRRGDQVRFWPVL